MKRRARLPELFLPYQQKWLADESELKIIEKSRRTGLSWSDALGAVLDGANADSPRNTYYFSFNKDNCRQYVEDCAQWAKSMNIIAGAVKEVVVSEDGKDITTFRIELSTGAEIMGLPAMARSIRSKQGNVVLDEAGFMDDFEGTLHAAKALVMWGGQIRVISTHNGDDNPFNTLIKNIRNGTETEWSLHRITFREAVDQGLYKRICIKRKAAWSKKGEKEFVEKMYRIYRENPDEELDVIPRASGQRYISRMLLDRATGKGSEVVRLELANDFLFKSKEEKTLEARRWFNFNVLPHLEMIEGTVFFGRDFARSGDLSVYWLGEEKAKNVLACRIIIEIRNAPFDEQKFIDDLIVSALEKRGKFGGGAYDAVGNGADIAEHAMLRNPGACIEVKESPKWYAEWFPKLKAYFEDLNMTVPEDETIKADFSAVTLKNGIPCIQDARTADRDKSKKRHGDAAIAAVLCACAWNECAAEPPPVFEFTRKTDVWR